MLKWCGESRPPSDEVQECTSGLKGEFEPAHCRRGKEDEKFVPFGNS